jgi:hypothetical protein
MRGYFVLFKGDLSAPYLDQRQMIGPTALLQYVVPQATGILRAVDAQLLDSGKALILFRANEINMRQDIVGQSKVSDAGSARCMSAPARNQAAPLWRPPLYFDLARISLDSTTPAMMAPAITRIVVRSMFIDYPFVVSP